MTGTRFKLSDKVGDRMCLSTHGIVTSCCPVASQEVICEYVGGDLLSPADDRQLDKYLSTRHDSIPSYPLNMPAYSPHTANLYFIVSYRIFFSILTSDKQNLFI